MIVYVYVISYVVVMVSFTESEYSESEEIGLMRIGVQLSRVLQQMITIQVATSGITAEGFILLTLLLQFSSKCYKQEME